MQAGWSPRSHIAQYPVETLDTTTLRNLADCCRQDIEHGRESKGPLRIVTAELKKRTGQLLLSV